MIPVWVWDNRRGTYVALPAPPQQFSTGNWGWTMEQYKNDRKIEDFCLTHSHLLNFVGDSNIFLPWYQVGYHVELKLKKPPKDKWYSKATARITKVQR